MTDTRHTMFNVTTYLDELADSAKGAIPPITTGWRLQMSLRHAEMTVQDMADELGVSRGTVSRWMNDKGTPPRRAMVNLWALRTGVDRDWLLTGETRRPDGPTDDGTTNPVSEAVTRNIRAEMGRNGVNQARLALVLGIAQQSLSNRVNGHTPFTLAEIEVLAAYFRMSVSDLLAGVPGPGGRPDDEAAAAVVRRQGLEPRTRWFRASEDITHRTDALIAVAA